MTRLVSLVRAFLVCGMLAPAPALAAGTPLELDLVSEPKGVLPKATLNKLWNAYKTAKECFRHPDYDPGVNQAVATLTVAEFRATPWRSPFTAVRAAAACTVTLGSLYTPAPIPKVTLDEAYGQRVQTVDVAESWFRRLTTYVRLTDDPLARKLIKDALLDWATNKSLGKGIRVSWGAKPVDYQMLTAIMALVTATAEVAGDLTADDRAVIGPWLNGLVKAAGASHWKDREDNKAFLRTYLVMLWGLIVGDDKTLQDAIDTYKLAVHDMRPDGSWPIDSQRGGMGLSYNANATGYLVLMATALKTARDIDLFGYSVDGRSVHTAVDFVASSIRDPAGVNRKYAISCPGGGDRWGSIDKPNMHFVEDDAGYLLTYATQFPDREAAKYILQKISAATARDSEQAGGAPLCQFAATGGTVTLSALEPPPPKPTLPKPTLVVTTKEEMARKTGHSTEVNSLLVSTIADGKKDHGNLSYNITGVFIYPTSSFMRMRLVINDPLGKVPPKALIACGARTVAYDDGLERAAIDFDIKDGNATARNADCIIKALPQKQAFLAKFLLTSFRDVAIGLVANDDIADFQSDALKIFFHRVALGELRVGM